MIVTYFYQYDHTRVNKSTAYFYMQKFKYILNFNLITEDFEIAI
jgi:hypothetical protein